MDKRAALVAGRAWRGCFWLRKPCLQRPSLPAPGLEGAGPAAPPPRPGLRSAAPRHGVQPSSLPGHSLGLGTLVLVAAPADGLGPLLVVTQVPLYHVVVSPAPAAVFGELDTCGEGRLPRDWSCQAPPGPQGQRALESLQGQCTLPRCLRTPSRLCHLPRKPSLISLPLCPRCSVGGHVALAGGLSAQRPCPTCCSSAPPQPRDPAQTGFPTLGIFKGKLSHERGHIR